MAMNVFSLSFPQTFVAVFKEDRRLKLKANVLPEAKVENVALKIFGEIDNLVSFSIFDELNGWVKIWKNSKELI